MSDKPTQHKARYQNGNSSRAESESEEEEGRSALGKPKRPKVEAEKTWEGSDVKRQKDNERKVMVGASSGPEKPDEKKDPREEGEEGRLKASQSNTAASKFQASNGGVDANEPGKKKKKKKKKSTNKQTK
ncbi:hypothetical protein L211DRAFT_849746 [Terfezia boudieri ATCC MYA-4762]|uniref:Uncharacterized protein n=1 Tax=Terfezia boudieri ATCC MYA-4762 TaxID=1051890 RepID=A0A3N4LKQ9_9PEZI|nr:hypothetical protein L211DRAFT_849746 [Terfezia boudieri ATCC MYA-4762]